MKKIIIATALFLSTSVSAETYIGFDLSAPDIKTPYSSDDIFIASGRVGHLYNDHLGAEVRLGWELEEGNSADIDAAIGAYMRLQTDVTDRINVYGLAGMVHVTTDTGPEDEDFSYGAGVEYRFGQDYWPDDMYISAEYNQLIDTHKYDISGVSLGVSYVF